MSLLEINDNEVLEGLALVNCKSLVLEDNMIISQALIGAQRVAVVVMGATGTEPAVSGLVGLEMADIAVVGNQEAAPGPTDVLKALELADRGQGVLLVVLNNAGDILTSNIVLAQAEKQGLNISRVIIHDDLIEGEEQIAELRQGLVGVVPVLKLAAKAAGAGKTLAEVAELAQALADNEASYLVKVADVKEGYGAEDIVALALPKLEGVLQLESEQKLLLIVNGNDIASVREQLVIYRSAVLALMNKGYSVVVGEAGDCFTGLTDGFVQLCLARLTEEQAELLQ